MLSSGVGPAAQWSGGAVADAMLHAFQVAATVAASVMACGARDTVPSHSHGKIPSQRQVKRLTHRCVGNALAWPSVSYDTPNVLWRMLWEMLLTSSSTSYAPGAMSVGVTLEVHARRSWCVVAISTLVSAGVQRASEGTRRG